VSGKDRKRRGKAFTTSAWKGTLTFTRKEKRKIDVVRGIGIRIGLLRQDGTREKEKGFNGQ